MAKLRLHPLTNKEVDMPHRKDESVHQLFERFFSSLKVQDDALREYYVVLLDGEEIDKDKWKETIIGDKKPLIAVVVRGGSNRGIFKQVLVMAAVIAVTVAMPASMPVTTALVATATSVGMTLLTNALFPPVDVGGIGGYDTVGYQNESSQTYTINNQSNKMNKYGTVPKPYGRNKMYPNIAAIPYTEITTDPITGKVIQNFFCIYSFGFGPMRISNIKIGDTELESYTNAYYRLVDLNKPAVSEGVWDDESYNSFEYYKGDRDNTSVGAAINSNQETAGPETPSTEYQLIRSGSDNGDGATQEVTLLFTAPQGLTTYGTNGSRAARTIDLYIEFAEEGTEDWYAFNNTTVAEITETTGVESVTSSTIYIIRNSMSWIKTAYDLAGYFNFWQDWGLPKGTTHIDSPSVINPNTYILLGNTQIAKVVSSTPITGGWRYELAAPLEKNFILAQRKVLKGNGGLGITLYWVENHPLKQQLDTGGIFRLTAEKTTPVFFSLNMKPKTTNQIKIRVTRVRSYGGYTYSIKDNLVWTSFNMKFDRAPIQTDKRHLFLEVKIQATDQLNGAISDLSALTSSVLNVYDSTTDTWSLEETSNPAWVFADLLTGEVNKRQISTDRLDTDTLLEWRDYCDEIPTGAVEPFTFPRFKTDFILDFKTNLTNILNKVSNAAGASLNLINGKYGVLIDKKKTTPVQLFTPRNTSNFSSSRKYAQLPHALKIRYVDGESNWAIREEIVYATGYDATNSTVFEELDTFGCTNSEQAWRYGMYNMAQAILRQEIVTIEVDFENLVCARGDYVLLQQDAMLAGGVPARVTSVSGNDITIDDSFVDGGGSYGYTFRGVGGIETGTLTIIDSDTATLTGTLPAVGDLLVWGEVDSITMNMVVKSISPMANLKAQITLIEQANEIHDAESSIEHPIYDPELTTPTSEFNPPAEVENLEIADNTWTCNGGDYEYYLEVVWETPLDSAVDIYEIYVNAGGGYALDGYSSTTTYNAVVDSDNLGVEHLVKVLAVDANGNKLSLGQVTEVSDTPTSKVTPPSDVDDVFINITNETIQLDWKPISDCDIDHYLIRYSPSVTATWESSIPLLEVDKSTSLTTLQGRTGAYLIKAVDWNGNESAIAASARTSIPNLFNLNVITETNDFPTLTGVKDQVVPLAGGLVLQEEVSGGAGVVEYYAEGYYTYKQLLDLGEIYTVRLQSLIEAEGYSSDDLLSNWPVIADIDSLASAASSDWSVEAYYRSTDQYITMDTWASLSAVTALDSGVPDVWSPWRKLTIGDFSGRIFQFKLKLISNKASITPRVFNGIIKADMPDRVESIENAIAPVTGYNAVYTPSFKGPGSTPMIQITQDDASQGDYYKITNKTLDGFTIKFYDNTDTLVERQFDAMIKGYGRKTTAVI